MRDVWDVWGTCDGCQGMSGVYLESVLKEVWGIFWGCLGDVCEISRGRVLGCLGVLGEGGLGGFRVCLRFDWGLS